DPSPSREDINVTQRLAKAGKVMDIPLLDHIILGDNRFHWRNYKGTPMNYRAVSDEELEAEKRRWAMTMAYNM
ncbi:MAG: hypothetical protein II178_07700, partial [Selenomonadaceae bacterium]|nr:hypothetical protein [Selenomonadaceae bacterium]